jgi:hypothetical protein
MIITSGFMSVSFAAFWSAAGSTDFARLIVSAIHKRPVISRMASSPMSWPRLYFL